MIASSVPVFWPRWNTSMMRQIRPALILLKSMTNKWPRNWECLPCQPLSSLSHRPRNQWYTPVCVTKNICQFHSQHTSSTTTYFSHKSIPIIYCLQEIFMKKNRSSHGCLRKRTRVEMLSKILKATDWLTWSRSPVRLPCISVSFPSNDFRCHVVHWNRLAKSSCLFVRSIVTCDVVML